MLLLKKSVKGFKRNFLENPYRSLVLICIYYCFFWGIFNLKNMLDSHPSGKEEWVLPLLPTLSYFFIVYIFSAKKIKEYSIFPLSFFFLPTACFAFMPYWFNDLSLSQALMIVIGYFIIFLLFMYTGKLRCIVITILAGAVATGALFYIYISKIICM